jgi:hypothetical protein
MVTVHTNFMLMIKLYTVLQTDRLRNLAGQTKCHLRLVPAMATVYIL